MIPSRWTIMSNFERMQFYLSVGLNDLEIAERIGVHRVTIARWKKEIRERYYEYERNLSTQANPTDLSPNTDYDFGSKKEPQPKGKDCLTCEHTFTWTGNNTVQICSKCGKIRSPSHNQ